MSSPLLSNKGTAIH